MKSPIDRGRRNDILTLTIKGYFLRLNMRTEVSFNCLAKYMSFSTTHWWTAPISVIGHEQTYNGSITKLKAHFLFHIKPKSQSLIVVQLMPHCLLSFYDYVFIVTNIV